MSNVNLSATIWRVCVATALALSIGNIPVQAASITIDGNLTDLITIVGTSTANVASALDGTNETNASLQPLESGNGFDVKNVYAYYDLPADVLYLGMNFYGTVGNSLAGAPTGTSPGTAEGALTAGFGSNRQYAFDQNEQYGFHLYSGQGTAGTQLAQYYVKGDASATTGSTSTDTTFFPTNPYNLVVARAVSESFNGVEFSISGLQLGYQQWITIDFRPGSADTNAISSRAEDNMTMSMQAVPIPAAVWLFTSGLLGFGAVARKHKKKSTN